MFICAIIISVSCSDTGQPLTFTLTVRGRWNSREALKDQDLEPPPASAGSHKSANLCIRNSGFVFLMVKPFAIYQKKKGSLKFFKGNKPSLNI